MNQKIKEFINFVTTDAPVGNKSMLEKCCVDKFALTRDRKIYHSDCFAVRFCYTKKPSNSFSNTVLSLSALEKYDHIPFFVVLVHRDGPNTIYMANSTFLKKISHSSKTLAIDNIVGSFNGSDIMRECAGIANEPNCFDELWAYHMGMDWNDNLERLVEATGNIASRMNRFVPVGSETEKIFQSVGRANEFVESKDFLTLLEDLDTRCRKCSSEIEIASHIENTNLRGRLIEVLITTDEAERKDLLKQIANLEATLPMFDTYNGLGDYVVRFKHKDVYTDIKTKILYLNSNPKAYNIDKFLKCMSEDRSVFMFYFIGIDEHGIMSTKLCSVYHSELLDNTILQTHWAGRASRGVAQFKGSTLNKILSDVDFRNNIVEDQSKSFLDMLLIR